MEPQVPPPPPPPLPLQLAALSQPSSTQLLEPPPEGDVGVERDAQEVQNVLPVRLVETRLMLAQEALVLCEKRKGEKETERGIEGGQAEENKEVADGPEQQQQQQQ